MKSPAKLSALDKDKHITPKKPSPQNHEELKTDYPISEKDEIKAAEQRLKESQKKNG